MGIEPQTSFVRGKMLGQGNMADKSARMGIEPQTFSFRDEMLGQGDLADKSAVCIIVFFFFCDNATCGPQHISAQRMQLYAHDVYNVYNFQLVVHGHALEKDQCVCDQYV